MKKAIILNADDFGLSKYHNLAVLKGYNDGFLTHASLLVNTSGFQEAVDNIIPKCPNLNIGIHLNIMEGKSLTDCSLLTDGNGYFCKGYLYLMLFQYNKNLQIQVENEFRAQIEKAIANQVKISRIDSHVHTHALPEIFKIVCKLAKEYHINYVRTQFENPYLVFPQCLSLNFLINMLKIIILNICTLINRKVLRLYDLKTNDKILGVSYTGMMNSKTVSKGLDTVGKNSVEIVIHPCCYDEDILNSHFEEFLITQDKSLNAKFLNNT